MLDHDLCHESHAVSPEPDSARWLTCCVLLADPNRGSRALIAELNRWPSKNTRHHPSDATPEGWPSASAIERWHRENPGAWRRSKPEATS